MAPALQEEAAFTCESNQDGHLPRTSTGHGCFPRQESVVTERERGWESVPQVDEGGVWTVPSPTCCRQGPGDDQGPGSCKPGPHGDGSEDCGWKACSTGEQSHLCQRDKPG